MGKEPNPNFETRREAAMLGRLEPKNSSFDQAIKRLEELAQNSDGSTSHNAKDSLAILLERKKAFEREERLRNNRLFRFIKWLSNKLKKK